MKKILLLFLLIITISLTSCSGFYDNEILIGFASSLDYSLGNIGVDSMYGAKLAIEEINDAGGVNGKLLSLIIRNDNIDPIKAVEVDNELNEMGVVGIIGHSFSSLASAIISNSTTNDILLISPTISTDSVTNLDDFFIRLSPTTHDQGYSIANAMHLNSPGDVMIVYQESNSEFANDLLNAFVERYTTLGYTVTEDDIHAFLVNQLSDYNTISNEINNSSPTNVLVIGSSFDVANIIQKVDNTENYNFYFPSWVGTSDLLRLAGPKINNSYSFNYYDFESTNPAFTTFRDNYYSQFGVNCSYSSLLAYESVYLLVEALKANTDWSPTNLKNYIVSQGTFSGLLEDIHINEYGDVSRTIYNYQIIDGEFVTLGSDVYA